jgi:hypothetical protein
VWYVVPVQAIAAGTSLRLYPDGGCERARFEKYREAWDFFRGDGVVDESAAEEGEVEEPVQSSMWRPIWKPRIFGMR